MTDGNITIENLSRTSREIAEQYSRSRIQTGELLITIRATVGAVEQVRPELDGANLARGVARIVPGDSVDNRFLLWAIRSNNVQSMIEARVKGTTFDEITLGQLRKAPIPHPIDINEQKTIVRKLSSVDNQLENEKYYLNSLQQLKKGLMQDLLSGTIRTTDKDISILDAVYKHD